MRVDKEATFQNVKQPVKIPDLEGSRVLETVECNLEGGEESKAERKFGINEDRQIRQVLVGGKRASALDALSRKNHPSPSPRQLFQLDL